MKLVGLRVSAVIAAALPFRSSSASRAACPLTVTTAKSIATFGPNGFNYWTSTVRAQLWEGGEASSRHPPGRRLDGDRQR